MKKLLSLIAALGLATASATAFAKPREYAVDPAHTFITFKVSHIGYAWIPGAFNDFAGSFTYDAENPANSKANFTVRTASLDTEHAERDKHLKGEDFFHVEKYPVARFVSTGFEKTGEKTGLLKGELTIKDVTQPVTFEVTELGAGEDPWGNYRIGFEARARINFKDFNITYDLGPVTEADIIVAVEGTRQ